MLARQQFKDLLAIMLHVSNKEASSAHTQTLDVENAKYLHLHELIGKVKHYLSETYMYERNVFFHI
jgi:hypothetical protein